MSGSEDGSENEYFQRDDEERDREINERIKQEMLANAQMVFISADWPMKISEYTIVDQIGAGMANNKVWRATCASHPGKAVAVKQIDLSDQSKDSREKITKEVQGMSLVTTRPNIVEFYCSFVDQDMLWIVMELMEGSMRDVIKWKYNKGFDDERVVAAILRETVRGLAFLHNNTPKFIHRDVKSGNILYDKEGHVKLADFGVSAILATHDERRTTMAGTWHWMAPEVIDPSDYGGYDERADLWSLGITAIELAYGYAPYSNLRPNQVVVYILQNPPPTLENPRTPEEPGKKWSKSFHDFVRLCLQTEPKKRPPTLKLLKHKFFDQIPKDAFSMLKSALVDGMPSLGERFQKLMEQRKAVMNQQNALKGKGSQKQKPSGGRGGTRRPKDADSDEFSDSDEVIED
jgi:serine/threonine-protein kinase OSR1/STK39